MSDFDRGRFGEEAQAGASLRILLRTGREYVGTVESVGAEQVALQNSNGIVRIPFAWIVDWEVTIEQHRTLPAASTGVVRQDVLKSTGTSHSTTPGDLPTKSVGHVEHAGLASSELPPSGSGESAVSGAAQEPGHAATPAFAKLIEINARFGAELAVDRLNCFGPEFRTRSENSSYITQQSIVRALSDFKNKWAYAHSVNELSRLQGSINRLKTLTTEFPDTPVFSSIQGSFLLELGELAEACKAFRHAAIGGDEPAFFNLAATALALGRRELACAALAQYFCTRPAFGVDRAWRVFVVLAIQYRRSKSLASSLAFQFRLGEPRASALLGEATVYALHALGHPTEAERVAGHFLGPMVSSSGARTAQDAAEALFPAVDADFGDADASALADEVRARAMRAETELAISKLLVEARRHNDEGNESLATIALNRALQLDASHVEAQQLKRAWAQRQGTRVPAPAPVQHQRRSSRFSPLAEGRAADLRKDLHVAERYYRQAIDQNDNWEAAAKGLAMLLPRMDRHAEAIELLESRLDRFVNKRPAQQILWNLYQIQGDYDRALSILQHLLKESAADERVRLYKSLAYCFYKAERFDDAESTLKKLLLQKPDDLDAKRVLEQLQAARDTGASANLAESFRTLEPIIEFANPQGDFLSFHLDRCDYFGVDATRLVKRDFSERDVEWVTQQIRKHGRQVPRSLARLNLTAARLLADLGEKSNRVNTFLSHYCAAAGDAFVSEGKHTDVARAFYGEAFHLATSWDNRLETTLNKFIMSYYDSPVNLLNTGTGVRDSLIKAIEQRHVAAKVIQGLLQVSVLNVDLSGFLIERVVYPRGGELLAKIVSGCLDYTGSDAGAFGAIDSTEKLARLWNAGREKARASLQKTLTEAQTLRAGRLTFDLLEEQLNRIEALRSQLTGDLDRQYASEARAIVQQIVDYSKQTEYGEQENAAKTAQGRCDELIREIEGSPTILALEQLRPYVLSLKDFVVAHFTQVQAAAEPEILVALATHEYYPNERSVVNCQITCVNAPGKSPASVVTITVEPSPAGEYSVEGPPTSLRESLRGGASITAAIPITVASQAKDAQVFTLHYSLGFTTRAGREVRRGGQSLSVPLYPASSFRPIANPYHSYASGQPIDVDNKEMLFGRDEYISGILKLVSDSPSPISNVIYGQKRSGKSSILIRLEDELKWPFVPVRFSILDLKADIELRDGLPVLYERIARHVHQALLDRVEVAGLIAGVARPPVEDFVTRPQASLDDFFSDLQAAWKKESQRPHVVLLIDEFTQLYNFIIEGKLSESFMSAWKGLRERRFFSCVVVGQDYMPRFRDRFPNEFQVSEPRRVGYLSPIDARRLIEEPTRIPKDDPLRPGQSRFQGAAGQAAIDRLIELTAGNPYYLQGLCDRLVHHMNDTEKAVLATDVYVEKVVREAIEGEQRVDRNYFDNLLDSGERSPDSIDAADALEVLRLLAHGSRNEKECPEHLIAGAKTKAPVSKILEDLYVRDVVARPRAGSYRIRVGLFKEWLLRRM